jgi:hypothetical protein
MLRFDTVQPDLFSRIPPVSNENGGQASPQMPPAAKTRSRAENLAAAATQIKGGFLVRVQPPLAGGKIIF